jgi:hypothetical protein
VFKDGACTATSLPAPHYGHCTVPFAGKGDICVHFTGSNGKDTDGSKALCKGQLKGTYADGECPPSTTGQCLKRCGLPYETLETIMFATAPEWEKACAAAKGTYTKPSS